MTCKTPFDETLWKAVRIDISGRSCPRCGSPTLWGGEDPLAFDKSILSTWQCQTCREELAFVVSESGDVYCTGSREPRSREQ